MFNATVLQGSVTYKYFRNAAVEDIYVHNIIYFRFANLAGYLCVMSTTQHSQFINVTQNK